ncbi:MAG: hypothetical protein IJ476_04135 [Bacteroidales bacterium]|nr:hypothetical protein [Bacteroidales bacterium]
MITSIGNNFGAGPIQINDFQSEGFIVLNARFDVDTTAPQYSQAAQLELYVPQLSLSRSSVTSCYIKTEELLWPGESYEELVPLGTTVKTWVKDANTICFEKLGIYDSLGKFTIIICTLYAPRGTRGTLPKVETTPITFNYQTAQMKTSSLCYIAENWCFLTFYYKDVITGWGEPITAQLEGFPTDITVDLLLIGGNIQATVPGVYAAEGKIQNGILEIPQTSTAQRATGSDPFAYLFAVRNTTNP